MTASEILADAKRLGWMPLHLYGKTPHKTLNARLSEHIRDRKEDALVFRVGPAKYFLSEFLADPSLPSRFKRKFRGILRSKQVRQERVLVATRGTLEAKGICGFVPFDREWFSHKLRSDFEFVDRRLAEKRTDIKQFVSYAIIVRGTSVLSYRRGKFNTASTELKGARSIGFGGHISEIDFDLFSFDFSGLFRNAARELYEELLVTDIDVVNSVPSANIRPLGYLNLDDTPEARKHVAIVMLYAPNERVDFRKGEWSINELNWLDTSLRLNDLSEFELWSEVLLRMIFENSLHLE
jgi:predicted NUDIX family phosphoesterase